MSASTPRRQRVQFVLLLLALFLPVILSSWLYFTGWRPSGTKNYGELVQPARPLSELPLRGWDGRPTTLHALPRKWTLLYIAPAQCGGTCEQVLHNMRQVALAQGKERNRVQTVVVSGGESRAWLSYVLKDHPGLIALIGSPEELAAFTREFSRPQGPAMAGERVYLVDPVRNLSLSYPANADPSGMRKDLKHLLKVSQIG